MAVNGEPQYINGERVTFTKGGGLTGSKWICPQYRSLGSFHTEFELKAAIKKAQRRKGARSSGGAKATTASGGSWLEDLFGLGGRGNSAHTVGHKGAAKVKPNPDFWKEPKKPKAKAKPKEKPAFFVPAKRSMQDEKGEAPWWVGLFR